MTCFKKYRSDTVPVQKLSNLDKADMLGKVKAIGFMEIKMKTGQLFVICLISDCDKTCQTCLTSTFCTTCTEGLLMNHPGHCVMQCALTEYYDEHTKICRPCHRKCLSCTGSAEDHCLSCLKNWYLLSKHPLAFSTCNV